VPPPPHDGIAKLASSATKSSNEASPTRMAGANYNRTAEASLNRDAGAKPNRSAGPNPNLKTGPRIESALTPEEPQGLKNRNIALPAKCAREQRVRHTFEGSVA